eukprot:10237374-Heterocapsa_arctica.AAC.1
MYRVAWAKTVGCSRTWPMQEGARAVDSPDKRQDPRVPCRESGDLTLGLVVLIAPAPSCPVSGAELLDDLIAFLDPRGEEPVWAAAGAAIVAVAYR